MEGRSQYQRMRSARSRRRGGWPTFRFVKGGIPRAYRAWDLWILRMLARSCISVGTGEDEKEARRCMSPRLPTFAKNKGAKEGHPPSYPAWDLWILRMLARSCISAGTGEDEKEARRCMSPRLPTFAKSKGAKVGHPSVKN